MRIIGLEEDVSWGTKTKINREAVIAGRKIFTSGLLTAP